MPTLTILPVSIVKVECIGTRPPRSVNLVQVWWMAAHTVGLQIIVIAAMELLPSHLHKLTTAISANRASTMTTTPIPANHAIHLHQTVSTATKTIIGIHPVLNRRNCSVISARRAILSIMKLISARRMLAATLTVKAAANSRVYLLNLSVTGVPMGTH